MNAAEITYTSARDTFGDILDRIDSDVGSGVSTSLQNFIDPLTFEIIPVWTVENRRAGPQFIQLEDIEGNFILVTSIRTHLDPPDDPLTVDVVEGQTLGYSGGAPGG